MTSTDINSQDYWNGRFDQDWEANLGKEQSRFFAHVALENLPRWMRSVANQQNWTVCDWGCAQGDGTDVLASHFTRERVAGVDFAKSAVEKARAAYPGLRFEAQDWLATDGIDEKFNIVFSSNTLEHFVDPFDVLSKLFQRAEQCVVLALPYRELNRISEHFFTFTAENIPLVANADWTLVHSAVVDCRTMNPTHWHGEQVILVYANRDWARKLTLADGSLMSDAPAVPVDLVSGKLDLITADNQRLGNEILAIKAQLEEQLQLQEQSQQLAQATAHSVELSAERYAELGRLSAERNAEVERLSAERRQIEADRDEMAQMLAEIKESASWRITKPFRAVSRSLRKVLGR